MKTLLRNLLPLATLAIMLPVAAWSADPFEMALPGGVSSEQIKRLLEGQGYSVEEVAPSPLDRARMSPSESQLTDPGMLSQGGRLAQLEEPSLLERDFSYRGGEPLKQFGYDTFKGVMPSNAPLTGAVSDEYHLGIGDEIIVTFHGKESRTISTDVDREGRIVLPNLPPVSAAGRPFGSVRQELEAMTASSMIGTQVFVSVGSLRSVSVMVVGEVRRPGLHRMTGLSTILDTIAAAGGINKTGSLRKLRVNRGPTTITLDLYDLLINGGFDQDITIMDGDRIQVPPIGKTVAIAGDVKRPGIFELREEDGGISAETLLSWGGGALRPSGNLFVQITLDESGQERVIEHKAVGKITPHNGDVILTRWRESPHQGSVYVAGHVRVPGLRSLANAPTIRRLIDSTDALDNTPYLPMAALITTDRATRSRVIIPVDLGRILDGKSDHNLQNDDVVVVLGADDIKFLSSNTVQSVLSGNNPDVYRNKKDEEKTGKAFGALGVLPESLAALQGQKTEKPIKTPKDIYEEKMMSAMLGEELTAKKPPSRMLVESQRPIRERADELTQTDETDVCQGLIELGRMRLNDQAGRFATAMQVFPGEDNVTLKESAPCPKVYQTFPELLPFMLEYAVALNGELRQPGVYPATQGTSLGDLLGAAGGLTREADLKQVELSRYTTQSGGSTANVARNILDLSHAQPDEIAINPGDSIRISPIYSDRDVGTVKLSGEFIRPGQYEIRRGERMSELVARAGGVTDQAYPFGTVFSRISVKESEKQAMDKTARELQSAMAAAMSKPGQSSEQAAAAAAAIREMVTSLQNMQPVGRVVVEADPTMLQVRPELDTILEPGDHIHMPKRPNFITVTGEVLNPSNLAFITDEKADDYIRRAGGLRITADEDRVFVIKPNGSAQPLDAAFWNYTPVNLPPGSTIVVPLDPAPLDYLSLTTDLSTIFGQLAIAAASVAAIQN